MSNERETAGMGCVCRFVVKLLQNLHHWKSIPILKEK